MTPAELIDCGVQPTQARAFAAPLTEVFERFEINTLMRRAAFLAQCMHESARFTQLEEGLSYRTPQAICGAFARLSAHPDLNSLCRNPKGLAAAAYCGRNGNGDVKTGDGWLYRGSGVIQLTGRANFARAAIATGRPYVEQPDLVRTNPADAVLTAGLYWQWNRCNEVVDDDDFDGLSKLINLGNRRSPRQANGQSDRRELFDTVVHALHLPTV